MAYAIGHISGCHLNPAISVGLVAGGRFKGSDLLPYIIAQVAGAIAGAALLYLIASGKAGFDLSGGLASNGYGDHSPGKYSLAAGLVTEVVMTFMFLIIIPGATDDRAPKGFAPCCHRTGTDTDSSDQYSGYQHFGESGTQHRPGIDGQGLGAFSALVVLGCSHRGRSAGRSGLSLAGNSRAFLPISDYG